MFLVLPRWIISGHYFKACSHRGFVSYRKFSSATYCSLLLWEKMEGVENHIQKRNEENIIYMWRRSACHPGRKQVFSSSGHALAFLGNPHFAQWKQERKWTGKRDLGYTKTVSIDELEFFSCAGMVSNAVHNGVKESCDLRLFCYRFQPQRGLVQVLKD